jgi:hypothetical protein
MVLASMGVDKTEEELRALCYSTAVLRGTETFSLVEAARGLGFTRTRKIIFISMS